MSLSVLYLYAGPRKKIYDRWKEGAEPDTYLVGLNHLKKYGISADFFENRYTEFLRKFSFNWVQLPALFVVRRYDVVFAGSGLLTLFLVKVLLRWKHPKWLIYNTYLSNLLGRNRQGIKAWFVRKAVLSADGVISPSRAQVDFLRKRGLEEEKNFFVPYGVDAEFYKKREGTARSDESYIFSAGRDMGRDYDTLFRAVRETPVTLKVGALPRNLKDAIPIPKNTTVSFYPAKDMPALFRNSRFVVIATHIEEKFHGSDCSGQYVLLEAMMCGRAVITSRRTTLSDYFEDEKDGLIVPPENDRALKNALVSLWNDPARANEMGRHGAKKAQERFSTERFAEKFAEILKKIAP